MTNVEKYNRWTVISIPSIERHRKVLCKCDCGTEKVVSYDNIKAGRSISCGCYLREVTTKDISGMKFDRLTAISISGRNYREEVMWNCACDCGKSVVVKTSSLVTGNTKSCGCLFKETRKKLDLKGMRFGIVTVLEEHSSNRRGVTWKCKCDCGKECYKYSSALNGGGSISCGCAKLSIKNRKPYTTESFRKMSRILGHKRRALKRNSTGSYTKDQVDDLLLKQKGRCANCGKKVNSDYHADHIVPLSKGGSNDIYNIQILCSNCNLRKYSTDPIVFAQREGRLL